MLVADDYLTAMQNEGVIVFKNRISLSEIQQITQEINKIREKVLIKLNTMSRPIQTYSDIAERHLGRLDYRCGFTAEVFNKVAEPINNIIKQLSPTIDFRNYWGAIPSQSNSGPTDMHRDVYPILNTTEGVNLGNLDLSLPPYYFTVFIPLVEITEENGPSQFIKGSHQKEVVNSDKAEIYAPLLSPGDMLIFDGRTLHKGSANRSKEERLIAYITYVANWYHDQTFATNNYLFPELHPMLCDSSPLTSRDSSPPTSRDSSLPTSRDSSLPTSRDSSLPTSRDLFAGSTEPRT